MLTLRAAFSGNNPRVAPLLDGTVTPAGFELEWETGDMGEMAARHLQENTSDVFEFSISDYLNIRSRADARWDWIALPIFCSKALLQLNTWVNVHSGITGPEELRGKRLAVGDYTMTAFLWFRAMLNRLYGVRSQDIAWYNGRVGEHSHSALLGVKDTPPQGVSITFLDRLEAANELLQSGQIDAAGATGLPIDTSTPHVQPLFPDRGNAFLKEFFDRVGFLPVNHTVLIQRRLIDDNPWLPEALYEAFERSKEEAYRRDPAARRVFPQRPGSQEHESAFGADPYLSGVAANRAMLSMACDQALSDGLMQKPVAVDDLFAPSLQGT